MIQVSSFKLERPQFYPYLLEQTGRLSLHERVTTDRAFSERIAMMSAAQRSITSLRYDRALSRAVHARSRARGADPARQLFQVGDVVYYWRGNGKAKREWAAHWHGPATVTGLQHESLWLAHRTTTVKCSKGHVRHATASEQLPLGPLLNALRAPPVPPGRDMQASEDLFMDLDEQPSKRPRDTPSSSTQQSDFDNPDEFVQRARNVSVPLPRTPEQPVPAPETPFQPAPDGNVAPETPQLSVPSTPPFQCFPGGETAPVTPRVENSKIAQPAPSFSVPVSRPMPSTFGVPSTLPPDPVVAHDHAPTQFDEESAVDTQPDDPFQFDDPPVPAPVILSQSNPVYDHRDDLPHHIRTQLQSRIRKPAQNLEPDAKRLRLDAGRRAVMMLFHPVQSVASL